jgi:hypothetical protein
VRYVQELQNRGQSAFLNLLFNNRFNIARLNHFENCNFNNEVEEIRNSILNENIQRWTPAILIEQLKIALIQLYTDDNSNIDAIQFKMRMECFYEEILNLWHDLEKMPKSFSNKQFEYSFILRDSSEKKIELDQSSIKLPRDNNFEGTKEIFLNLFKDNIYHSNDYWKTIDAIIQNFFKQRSAIVEEYAKLSFKEKLNSGSSTNIDDEYEKFSIKIKNTFNEFKKSFKICLEKCNLCYLNCVKQKEHSIEDAEILDKIKDKIQLLNKKLSSETFKDFDFETAETVIETYNQQLLELEMKIESMERDITFSIKANQINKSMQSLKNRLSEQATNKNKLDNNLKQALKDISNLESVEDYYNNFTIQLTESVDQFKSEIKYLFQNSDCSEMMKKYDESKYINHKTILIEIEGFLSKEYKFESSSIILQINELQNALNELNTCFNRYLSSLQSFYDDFMMKRQNLVEFKHKLENQYHNVLKNKDSILNKLKIFESSKEEIESNLKLIKMIEMIRVDFNIENVETVNKYINLSLEHKLKNEIELKLIQDEIMSLNNDYLNILKEISHLNEIQKSLSFNSFDLFEEMRTFFINRLLFEQSENEISLLNKQSVEYSSAIDHNIENLNKIRQMSSLKVEIQYLEKQIDRLQSQNQFYSMESKTLMDNSISEEVYNQNKFRGNSSHMASFIQKYLSEKLETIGKKQELLKNLDISFEMGEEKLVQENLDLARKNSEIKVKLTNKEKQQNKIQEENQKIIEKNQQLFKIKADEFETIHFLFRKQQNLKDSLKHKKVDSKESKDNVLLVFKINELEAQLHSKLANLNILINENSTILTELVNQNIVELNKSLEELASNEMKTNLELENTQKFIQNLFSNDVPWYEEMSDSLDLDFEFQQNNIILLEEDLKILNSTRLRTIEKIKDMNYLAEILNEINFNKSCLNKNNEEILKSESEITHLEKEIANIEIEIQKGIKKLTINEFSNKNNAEEKSKLLFIQLEKANERRISLIDENNSINTNSVAFDTLLKHYKQLEDIENQKKILTNDSDLTNNEISELEKPIQETILNLEELSKILSHLDENMQGLTLFKHKIEYSNNALAQSVEEISQIYKIEVYIKENEIKINEIMREKLELENDNKNYTIRLTDENQIEKIIEQKSYLIDQKLSLKTKIINLEDYIKSKNESKNLQVELETSKIKLAKACDCGTDHVCKCNCDLCNKKEICFKKSGHEGTHICKKPQHNCKQTCDVYGCVNFCTFPHDHENPKYHRCEDTHQCSNQCIYCSNKCTKTGLEKHENHMCSEPQCSKSCVLCSERCADLNHDHNEFAEEVRVKDRKTFEIQTIKKHLCENKHNCSYLCDHLGVCEIIFAEKIKDWHSTTADFQFTYIEPKERKVICAETLEINEIDHDKEHKCEKENHTCNAKCPDCGSYCMHKYGHSGLHSTISHRNKENCFFVNTTHKNIEIVSKDKSVRVYTPGERSTPEICSESCARRGRSHYHLVKCKGGSDCIMNNLELKEFASHSKEKYIGFEDYSFDKLLCFQYWESFRWRPPLNDESIVQENKLCNCHCPHYSHKTDEKPSFCSKVAWHTSSLLTKDHIFECEHDDTYNGVDVCFVLDTTGSMSPYIMKSINSIENIIKSCTTSFGLSVKQIQFAVVAYRDHPPQDESYVTKVQDFSDELEAIEFLNTLDANGGGKNSIFFL